MNCGCCGTEGILNTALGKEFYYCRECKTEIVPPTEEAIWDAYEAEESERTGNDQGV